MALKKRKRRTTREALAESLDLRLFDEVFRWDAGVGLLGGAGGVLMATSGRSDVTQLIATSAGVLGVVIGAAVAGAAVIAAFMDQPFLRKLGALNQRPGYFLAPLVFTGLLGIVGVFALLCWYGVSEGPEPLRVLAGAVSGLFGWWSLASLIPDLVVLSELADIKATAATIPDDHPL